MTELAEQIDEILLTPPAEPETPEVEEPPAAELELQKPAVAVAFDGVLHSAEWLGPTEIPNPPNRGAIEWLNELAADLTIVIVTRRALTPGGASAVIDWLEQHGYWGAVTVTAEYPRAVMHIDGRGWRFTGQFPTRKQLRRSAWRPGDPVPTPVAVTIKRKNLEQRALEWKLSRAKGELRQTRRELIIEVLLGRGFTADGALEWLVAHEGEEHHARLEAARTEAVR